MADRPPELPKLIGDLLGLNPLEADSDDVAMQARSLGRQDLKRLVGCCDRALQRADMRKADKIRIALLEVLVGLLPDSAEVLKHLLSRWSGAYVYEVHFSLFITLGYIGENSGAQSFAKEIPRLVEAYLNNVPRETGFGAWKAGDLLGDHWRLDESVPVLIRSARNARFVAGRAGAIHGLAHALGRRPEVNPHLRKIRRVLREVVKSDRSESIRESAKWILDGKDPCSYG
ncbi:MAG: hypothetical protein ACE5EC_10730 [Phycisphaerae bacterium]